MLEWFQIIISKKYTVTRFTALLSRNHSTLFLVKERSADAQYLIARSSRSQMFFKISVLKSFAIFARKLLCWIFFLINPPQVFSCECCKIFKNTYSEKHLRRAAIDHEILSFWTCYEKRISCAFAPTQLSLEQKIKELKSDCRFYE